MHVMSHGLRHAPHDGRPVVFYIWSDNPVQILISRFFIAPPPMSMLSGCTGSVWKSILQDAAQHWKRGGGGVNKSEIKNGTGGSIWRRVRTKHDQQDQPVWVMPWVFKCRTSHHNCRYLVIFIGCSRDRFSGMRHHPVIRLPIQRVHTDVESLRFT